MQCDANVSMHVRSCVSECECVREYNEVYMPISIMNVFFFCKENDATIHSNGNGAVSIYSLNTQYCWLQLPPLSPDVLEFWRFFRRCPRFLRKICTKKSSINEKISENCASKYLKIEDKFGKSEKFLRNNGKNRVKFRNRAKIAHQNNEKSRTNSKYQRNFCVKIAKKCGQIEKSANYRAKMTEKRGQSQKIWEISA